MAKRRTASRRPAAREDALPMDIELDDFGDGLDDDEDDLESSYAAPRRAGSRRGAASRLPHDWADFDYGGGLDDGWR